MAKSHAEEADACFMAIVPMANLNRRHARTAVPNSKDSRPLAASDRQGLAEESCECYQLVRTRVASHLPKTYTSEYLRGR